MKQLLSNLVGFAVATEEGNQGVVRDFYFDDEQWNLRYLVCRLFGIRLRTVLVPKDAFLPREWDLPVFPLGLTAELLRRCPKPESDIPVSRQRAQELTASILSPENGGIGTAGLMLNTVPFFVDRPGAQTDPRLRSFRAVRRYAVRNSAGGIGKVTDFAIDDADWVVHGLVVRLKHRGKDGTIMVPPQWIKDIDWLNGTFWTELDAAQWDSAPRLQMERRSAGPFAR